MTERLTMIVGTMEPDGIYELHVYDNNWINVFHNGVLIESRPFISQDTNAVHYSEPSCSL